MSKRSATETTEQLEAFLENSNEVEASQVEVSGGEVEREESESQPASSTVETDESTMLKAPIPTRPKRLKFKKRSFQQMQREPQPNITLKSVRVGSLRIDHKRCIKSREEGLDIEKMRSGTSMQSLSTIRPNQLRWLQVQQNNILKAIDKVREGEEVRFDLGQDLYICVNVYGEDVITIVHIRYYFHNEDDTKLFPSKNGITVTGDKWLELSNVLLSFNLPPPNLRAEQLVGQIVQEDIRDKLWNIAYKKNIAVELSTDQLFVERHIKEATEELEKDMTRNFKIYDSCISYIQLPMVKGEDVFKFYYNDEMRKRLRQLTEVNDDYHTPSQMLIETVIENENIE